jgi:hypothetical protein
MVLAVVPGVNPLAGAAAGTKSATDRRFVRYAFAAWPPETGDNKPAESKPGGTRPTTPVPEPARPGSEAEEQGARTTLSPAPAERPPRRSRTSNGPRASVLVPEKKPGAALRAF